MSHTHKHSSHAHRSCQGHDTVSLTEALNRIKAAGLKITRPRQTLVEAILRQPSPFSAEELFTTASKSQKSLKIDLVTVYRSLTTFTEIGLLGKVDLDDGVVRYEVMADDGSHHHHITCTCCRRVEPLTVCEIQGQEKILSQMGYTQLTHRLEFFGICSKCIPKKNPSSKSAR